MDLAGGVKGLLPGEPFSVRFTYDALTDMVREQRRLGRDPKLLLVSEYDRNEIIQEIQAHSLTPVPKDDEDKFNQTLGFIDGCLALAHRDVPKGKIRVICAKPNPDTQRVISG
jgi:hypothetical protein